MKIKGIVETFGKVRRKPEAETVKPALADCMIQNKESLPAELAERTKSQLKRRCNLEAAGKTAREKSLKLPSQLFLRRRP